MRSSLKCSSWGKLLFNWNYFLAASSNCLPLSDETKKFHRDWYQDFFSRPKFSRLRLRLFFETKYFWDRYRDFFSRPNVFETDTETFFWDQMFSRPISRLFFETNTETFFWDQMFSRPIPRLFLDQIFSRLIPRLLQKLKSKMAA